LAFVFLLFAIELNDCQLNSRVADRSGIDLRKLTICNNVIDLGRGHDQRKASPVEFAGVAHLNHFFRRHHHGAIDTCL
jgi:hypothetical protein